jgi:hypothetical protein
MGWMYRISTRVAWQLLGRMGATEEWRIDIYKEANRSVLSASSHQEVLLLATNSTSIVRTNPAWKKIT